VWKIEDFGKKNHPTKYKGHFWTADSYLILYEYKILSTEKAVLYFWQGRETSVVRIESSCVVLSFFLLHLNLNKWMSF
jgi:hypothetical protein